MATINEGSREPHPMAKTMLSVTGAVLVLGLTFSVLAGLGSAAPRLWGVVAGSGWVSRPFDQFLGLEGQLGSKGIFQIDCLWFLLLIIPFGLIKLGEGIEWALDPRERAKSRERAAEERRAQAAQEDVRKVERQARRERVTERSFRFGKAIRRAMRKIWDGPFVTPPISSPVSVGWVLLKVLETIWRLGVILLSAVFLLAFAAYLFGS
jgi:hypothetical protein